MDQLQLPSQWDSLLHNLGAWRGSFTHFSPAGDYQDDTPTLISLEGLHDNRTVRQTIQHFSQDTGELVRERVLEYSSLNRSTLVFPNGEFSQGSIQFAPFSEFGAEMGFIQGDRRLRLVQLFDKDAQLSQLTLIREHCDGTPTDERPMLTVEDLIGVWQGEAITLYADFRPADTYASSLSIWREGDRLIQRLQAPSVSLESTASIQGSVLRFEQSNHLVQVLLLPDGASSNTPRQIPRGQPFFLEAGWLVNPNLRQRIIRSYDARGSWTSLTLVSERKLLK